MSGPKLEDLWRNCRDSFVHALEHFSSLRIDGDAFHNKKWIILSVHHAAEVFANFLLKQMDPDHPRDVRFGRPYFPSFRSLISTLPQHAGWTTLTAAERCLITEFLPSLCDDRDALMHRGAEQDLEVSASAIALLGLLHVVRRRTGEEARDLLWSSPPVEADVVDAMHWKDFERYNRLVEQFVAEYYPVSLIDQCPWCGAMTRTFGIECEACFSEEARQDSAQEE